MSRLLQHDSLWIRFFTLLGLGTVIFLALWGFSYYLLPEGILRGRTAAAVLAGEEAAGSFTVEFLRIAFLNMFMLVVVVAANRIIVVYGFPLGYLPPILLSILYAITLGTNSFSIPLPHAMAPTFGVLFRSGPYEIAAYMLIATATYKLPTNIFKRLIPPDSKPIEPPPRFSENVNWTGVALAMLLLIGANLWEAYQIVSL